MYTALLAATKGHKGKAGDPKYGLGNSVWDDDTGCID